MKNQKKSPHSAGPASAHGPGTTGPAHNHFGLGGGCLICFKFKFKFKTISNQVQIISNFDRSKKVLPEIKKFEIKYGCEGIE
jgi:hypothetical protein